MKFPSFDYVRAASPSDAFDLLEEEGGEARILAGGQSLLATLALRLSEPRLLIDIGGLTELSFIEKRGGTIRIGALARHCDLEQSPLLADRLPLISQAMPHVAHAAIRNRGTIGGSLSHADPAAELPACMLALGATMVLASRAGERRVPAEAFFKGLYETDLRPGELLVRVEIASSESAWRWHFGEISRRRGDFAIVGLAAGRKGPNTAIEAVRLVYFGCADRPVRAHAAEQVLAQQFSADAHARRMALREALGKDLAPQSDLQASSDTRMHLATVLAERALLALMQ